MWTQEDSPYQLSGQLLVPQGISLQIGPGVELDLNGWFIRIEGLLEAVGTPEDPISFFGFEDRSQEGDKVEFGPTALPWSEEVNSGSIIQHAKFRGTGDSALIVVIGSSPKLSFLDVSNSRNSGVYFEGGSPVLEDSRICNSKGFGVIVREGSSPVIRRNLICQNGESGIGIDVPSSGFQSFIQENQILENGVSDYDLGSGIRVGTGGGGRLVILLNKISGNLTNGLMIGGGAPAGDEIQVEQNSIADNEAFAVRLNQLVTDVDVSSNWWGSVDSSSIEEMFYDQTIDFRLGRVIFEPFLTGPPEGVAGDPQ